MTFLDFASEVKYLRVTLAAREQELEILREENARLREILEEVREAGS